MMDQMPHGTGTGPQIGDLSDKATLSLDSMEGLYELPVIEKASTARKVPSRSFAGQWSVGLIAALAYAVHYLPFAPFRIAGEHGIRRPVSAAIIAILLGFVARGFDWMPLSALNDCKRLVKTLMPVLIVLTGAGLNLAAFSAIGVKAFGITVCCIVVSCTASLYFGKLFGAWPKTSILIGAGTAICGTSAIIAAAPVIGAEDEDITISVGTVNVLGLVLMLCFPLLGGLLQMTDDSFGVWAGTSIHAVPQVVAAGFAYSERAATVATLVKLVRVTLLAPFLVVLVLIHARRTNSGARGFELRLSRVVPPFLWGFLCLAVLGTVQIIPTLQFHLASWIPGAIRDFQIPLASVLVDAGNVLLTIVMAAMGLEVNLRTMSEVGRPAMFTGLAACVLLSGVSLLLIRLLL
jgi:uncharacterized integral membrane protein (TIGR00698 family)